VASASVQSGTGIAIGRQGRAFRQLCIRPGKNHVVRTRAATLLTFEPKSFVPFVPRESGRSRVPASLIGRVCQASSSPFVSSTSVDRFGVSHASLRSRLDLDRRCTHWSDGAGSHALGRARGAAVICGFTRTIVHT
jgi:hypothetical protein